MRLDSFLAVLRASDPVFVFCAPGLIFGGTERVGSRFHVVRARTHVRRYRGRRIPFSSFTCLDSFSAVPRASGPVFIFCAPGLIFGRTEGVGSRFHVLRAGTRFCGTEGVRFLFHVVRARTRFRRYRGRPIPFSCCACPDSFTVGPRASGPVFMFCAPGLVFDGTEGVPSRFLVVRARTRFQ
jgi:hypothetical protein